MTNHSGIPNVIVWGCLLVVVISIILITSTSIFILFWNNYWYKEDKALRREPIDNLVNFNDVLKDYLSEHEGNYPDEQGVYGLAELTSKSTDLRMKDD